MFGDELVVGDAAGADGFEDIHDFAVAGRDDIGGAAGDVGAFFGAAHGMIDGFGAEAAEDDDGLLQECPHLFQLFGQALEVGQRRRPRRVEQAAPGGDLAGGEFGQGEMIGEFHFPAAVTTRSSSSLIASPPM